MKISHLIVALLVLGIGGTGVYYSLEQQKIMKLLVATHGGVNDSAGLRKSAETVDAERAPVTAECQDALKAAGDELKLMQVARTQRNESEVVLNQTKDTLRQKQKDLAEVEEDVKEMKERITNLQKRLAALREQIQRSVPCDWDDDASLVETVEKLKAFVQEQIEANKAREKEFAEKQVVRKAAIEKLSGLLVELNKISIINEEFFDNYCKNDDEFVITAVNPQWKFVVFRVPENSRLVAGDTTPLIVKRDGRKLVRLRIVNITPNNEVTAEYDPAEMPAGVTPQPGDVVFREKPLGS